jgi:hypothetical protein
MCPQTLNNLSGSVSLWLNQHFETMAEYLLKRTGKLLFPHLARDQRKHRMRIILLVLGATCSGACLMAMLMMSGRH